MTLKLVALAGLIVAALATPVAAQDNYPDKQVRIVVGSSPGGTADIVSRLLAEKLGARFGQSFFVENMPGSGGALASTFLAKAPADGYTLQFAFIGSHAILPHLNKLEYDPVADFAPVSLVSFSPNLLLANPDFGVKTVDELVTKLKAEPGKYDYGSAGVGGSHHLSTELLLQGTGTQAVHIPYPGSGQLLAALIANEVPFAFDTMTAAVPHIQAGTLVALAISSKERSPVLPDVPAVAESVPGYEVIAWNGVLAPAGTPPAIVDKLSAAIAEYVKSPEGQAYFTKLGTTGVGSTPAEFGALIRSDLEKFGKVIEAAGIKAN
jgi:tripartite-type tricarboxylate transporter receptor subunit TctC